MTTQAGILETPTTTPFIEQVMGPDKGRTVDLSGEKMSIGRADGNDIVVQSEGVSRVHAFLMQSDGSWYIRDNGSKNGILVNGQRVTESWLQNGDVVQVGNFVFRFNDPAAAAASAMPATEAPMVPMMEDPTGAVAMAPKKPNRRIIIYGLLFLALGYYYMQQQNPTEEGTKTTTATDATGVDPVAAKEELEKLDIEINRLQAKGNAIEPDERGQLKDLQERREVVQRQLGKASRDFEVAKSPETIVSGEKRSIVGIEDPELKEAEKYMEKLDWTNSSLREAEQFFRKGQREYLAGSFQRAIDSFQTALSFYRGHRLAENYLRRTIYEVESEARKHMDMGVQYFESLQFQRALYHFNEVITLMAHRPTENIVSQAEKYVSLCKRRLQAAELFP